MNAKEVTVTVRVANIGNSWIGATEVAGITVRGRRCDEPLEALESTFAALASTTNDEAVLALELALESATIGELMGTAPALEAGPEAGQ